MKSYAKVPLRAFIFFPWMKMLYTCGYFLGYELNNMWYDLYFPLIPNLAELAFFKKKKQNIIYLFYFWLHWVFVAAHGLPLVVVSGGYSSLCCMGFSLWWLPCCPRAQVLGFSSCSTRAQKLWPTGLVAPRQVRPSRARDRTCVPLHLQANSLPLDHQGSLRVSFYFIFSKYLPPTEKWNNSLLISRYLPHGHPCR